MPAAQWAVARRYSEFFQLNQALRARFDSVKALDFPRRRVVMKLQKDFLEKRRVALEKYLKVCLTPHPPFLPLCACLLAGGGVLC